MIRRLGPGDGEELRALNRRFKEDVPSLEDAEAFVANRGHVVLVAGQLEAFLLAYVLPRIDGRLGVFLYELGVAEQARRRGIGSSLVEEAKRLSREAGAFEMYVLTEPDNVAANALYESTGASGEGCVMWVWTL